MPSVLIVEDDLYVRECLYRGFIAEGWTVREVGDPGEALGWAQVQSFDLILADVMMPGMSGTELVSRIRALRPETRALLMSGYPESLLNRQSCDMDVAPLLQKPFPIRSVLDRATALLAPASAPAEPSGEADIS